MYDMFEYQQTFVQHLCENFDSIGQMQMVVLSIHYYNTLQIPTFYKRKICGKNGDK
jgi:hypothetical protein